MFTTLEALQQYKQLLEQDGVQHVKAVATAAVRECYSPGVFLAAAEQVLGHPVQLLSGESLVTAVTSSATLCQHKKPKT